MLRPLAVLFVALAFAPLQCGGSGDDADQRIETPPEALYGLAEKFRADGDERARRETLAYIVERYPNSRFAVRAKHELTGAAPTK
jgi:hypothetical protein